MLFVIKHVVPHTDNIICLSAIQLMHASATRYNSCCAKLSTSFLLSYGFQQARAELNWLQDSGSLPQC